LRLAQATAVPNAFPCLTGCECRVQIERLVDMLIEIIDLADGDADSEPAGDEFEDGDGA